MERLRPAYASVSIAEITRDGEARGINILRRAVASGTAIQFILYTPDDVRLLSRLRERIWDTVYEPSTLLVAGRYGVVDNASVAMIEELYRTLDGEGMASAGKWMACAFGRGEMACLTAAIERGGHARVGFENAIVDAGGKFAASNAERVAMVAELARIAQRPIMTGESAADILG